MSKYRIPDAELTDTQMLRLILRRTERLEQKMANLEQAVSDLQAAVTALIARVGPTVDELKAQVIAGQQALDAFVAEDALEDSDYEAAAAALQEALQAQIDGAQAAADAIEGSVAEINTVVPAATEEPPVDEEPVEEPPVDEEQPPVEGLPTDQPTTDQTKGEGLG